MPSTMRRCRPGPRARQRLGLVLFVRQRSINHLDSLLMFASASLKGDEIIGGVQCMFANEYKQQLADLSKGMTVIVFGKCDGLLVNVILRGCQLARGG